MTDQQIIDGNKLIAEFMGVDTKYSEEVYRDSKSELRHFIDHRSKSDGLDFHKSWDWLMPVVEKIETSEIIVPEKYKKGFMKNSELSTVDILTMYDNREEFKGWSFNVSFGAGATIVESCETRYRTKIEATYSAVIQFITWYNNQQKQ